jgi:pyruvate,water dikinase
LNLVAFIDSDTERDVAALGGKGAGLAFLVASGLRIPPAFVVTADGYRAAVPAEVRADVTEQLAAIPAGAAGSELEERTAAIRALIVDGTDGHALTAELSEACRRLGELTGADELAVAVRSSSIAEDSADKSFAGEHDTYLWVDGPDEVDRRVRDCWASLVTSRAVSYRAAGAPDAQELAMAVVVQQMAPARAAGVFMTLNPANGDRSKVMIESVWGLGEPLVSGEANPDRFLVDKITGEIVRREPADKPTAAVRDPRTGRGIAMVDVDADRREAASLTDPEIAELLRVARVVERAAGGPQDGEFVVLDGDAPENVLLLQCRPETVWSRKPPKAKAKGKTAMESVLATLTSKPDERSS